MRDGLGRVFWLARPGRRVFACAGLLLRAELNRAEIGGAAGVFRSSGRPTVTTGPWLRAYRSGKLERTRLLS